MASRRRPTSARLPDAIEHKIKNIVLAVCMLDTATTGDSAFGSLVTPETMRAAQGSLQAAWRARRSRPGADVRLDAAERPDLELLGQQLPARQGAAGFRHPVLERRYDAPAGTTALRLHRPLLHEPVRESEKAFAQRNGDRHERSVKVDSYVVAGVTDHITPWKSVYQTAKIMGNDTKFILSNSGHLQSLLNPPSNQKASFVTGPLDRAGPDAFLAGAKKHAGQLVARTGAIGCTTRSDDEVPAPRALGNARYRAADPAPGTYVFEQ